MQEYPEDEINLVKLTDKEIKTVKQLAWCSAMIANSYIIALALLIPFGIIYAIIATLLRGSFIVMFIPALALLIPYTVLFTSCTVRSKRIGKSKEWTDIVAKANAVPKKRDASSQRGTSRITRPVSLLIPRI